MDAVVSDELNHASIIDGIRLCKAKRYRYRNNDSEDLEAQLNALKEQQKLARKLSKSSHPRTSALQLAQAP